MKDRFKFRVYDKENKKHINFNDFKKGYIEFNFDTDTQSIWIEYDKSRYDVLQCTGLKDKNGKLIYENDIVADVLTNKFTINFDEKYLSFLLTNIKTKESMVFYPSIKLEIIENIFKNKELIKGVQNGTK